MKFNNIVVDVVIEDKKYIMSLNFGSAIEFQKLSKKSIFEGIEVISNKQDLTIMTYLIASCLKNEKGKSVGIKFVEQLDLMTYLPILMEALGKLMQVNETEVALG